MVTLTYESLSSEDWSETKLQAKFDKSHQIIEQQNQESENI